MTFSPFISVSLSWSTLAVLLLSECALYTTNLTWSFELLWLCVVSTQLTALPQQMHSSICDLTEFLIFCKVQEISEMYNCLSVNGKCSILNLPELFFCPSCSCFFLWVARVFILSGVLYPCPMVSRQSNPFNLGWFGGRVCAPYPFKKPL